MMISIIIYLLARCLLGPPLRGADMNPKKLHIQLSTSLNTLV